MSDNKDNTGLKNSGDYNSGSYNSGYYNSGYRNSGDHNSGDYNSGSYNSGDYNSGFFNTNEPTVRLFNKDTNLKRSEISIPYINLQVAEWIPEERMTSEQKKADPNFFVKKGTLIKRDYKEAFTLAWKTLNDETKQQFLDLPNFDAEIFFEITGVDVRKVVEPSCNGKIVEIEGKKYKLVEEK